MEDTICQAPADGGSMDWWRMAAVLGALGVALGAFGAHGLKEYAGEEAIARWWDVGARYHLLHAVALLGVAAHPARPSVAGWCFVVGIAVFSGSLYAMTLTGETRLGMITPIGGVALIAGWVALGLARVN